MSNQFQSELLKLKKSVKERALRNLAACEAAGCCDSGIDILEWKSDAEGTEEAAVAMIDNLDLFRATKRSTRNGCPICSAPQIGIPYCPAHNPE